MNILYLIAIPLLINMTWIYYVAIMRLKYVRDTLNPVAKVMGYMGLAVGFPLDILLNLFFSIVLLDMPKEVTLSRHLSRLNDDTGWRGKAARWICANLLDPFDPSGAHCN